MSIPILSPSPLSQLPSSNFNEEGLRSQVQVVENSSSLSSSRDIQGSRRVSVIQNNHQSSCSPHQRLLHRSQTTFDVLLPPLQHQQNKRKTQQQILPSLEQRRATTGGQGIIRSNNRTSITNRKINDNDTFQSLVTTKKQSNSWLLPYQNDESDSSNKNDAIAKSLHLPLHIVIPGILSCDVMVLRDMSPSQTMDVNISMALKDFSRSMYQSSIVRLNRTILKNPHSFLPRFLRGICHYYLECYIASKRDFSVCCMNTCNNNHKDAEYDRALAFFNRSVVWMKMNNSERAMSDINEAIDIYSFEMGFFSNRALLYRRRGNFEAAQQDYKMMRRIEADEIRENDEGAIPIRRDLASIPMRVRTDLLKRPNAIATQSSARIRKTMIGRQALQGNKSPGSKRARSQLDLKTSVYGQVHSALTCPPEQRTKAHLEVLVKESRMMPAFAHLDTRQLNTLWQFLEYKSYTSNTRLFEEGDSAEDYMLVWSGSVSARVCKRNSLIKHSDNVARALAMEREFTVNTMKAGETLGEAIMLEGGVRKASCVTEEPSEILLLKKEHFRQTFHVFLQKSHDEKVDFLSSFDFLSHWDKVKLDELAHLCREKRYHRGETIIHQNDPANSIFFVKTGMLSLIRNITSEDIEQSTKNCEICLCKLSSGDIFGEATILDNKEMIVFPTSAKSETLSICYRLDKIQLEKSHWDKETKRKLIARSVKIQDDSTLLRSHLKQNNFKKKSAVIVRKVRNMIQMKNMSKQFSR